MTNMHRTAVAAVALFIATVLTGCSPLGAPGPTSSTDTLTAAPSSRSLATVEDALAEIPGVQFSAARAWDGTTPYVTATLSTTTDFTGDPSTLIDYALGQLASQNEIDRGRFVRFTFDAPGQTVDSTRALLSSLEISADQYAGGSSLELASADLDRRYGTWPSAAPPLPPTLIDAG